VPCPRSSWACRPGRQTRPVDTHAAAPIQYLRKLLYQRGLRVAQPPRENETMSTVRFTTEIGQDLVIHPPADIHLTPGKAEVIVVQPSAASAEALQTDVFPAGVPEIAKDLVRFARGQNAPALPPDFALNHDHYLHGAPKGIDQP
jgi:hypothetical protein